MHMVKVLVLVMDLWDAKEVYSLIPSDAKIEWDDELKQNYAEYQNNKERTCYG